MSRAGVTDLEAGEVQVAPARTLGGDVRVPGDKSLSHRALVFSALCREPVTISGLSDGGDVATTARVLTALGARFSLEGPGCWRSEPSPLQEAADVLDCGNAGTTARLLAGLLAGLPGLHILTGDTTLRRRPMARVTNPLRRMGARVDGREDGCLLPLAIRGGELRGGVFHTEVASAQVKSAILLAGLGARGEVVVKEPTRSRDHSERMLRACGVLLDIDGATVVMRGGQELHAPEGGFLVPGDLSAAAFFLAAAALGVGQGLRLLDIGTNPTRTGMLRVLERMGVPVVCDDPQIRGGEPIATLRVAPGELRATEVGGAEIPTLVDEIPILAVVAARAAGTTVFRDASELRAKESDRVRSTVAMLQALGVAAEERPDGLVVHGDPDRPFAAGTVRAAGDHRIAMSAAIAALCASGPVTLLGAASVDTSFPGFFTLLEQLRVD